MHALKEIIHPDQIGYMERRFCGENTRQIADVIAFLHYYKKPGIILLADFEKAFDTVNWEFLYKCLKTFGFRQNFRKWVSIIYNNIESCVTNNVHQLTYFKIARGIRQGCPLSALLFLIVAEVVACMLRNSVSVTGISVNNISIKLCQFADDMTLFLADVNSPTGSFKIFEEYYRYTGLKLNKSKTEAVVNDGSIQEKNLSASNGSTIILKHLVYTILSIVKKHCS